MRRRTFIQKTMLAGAGFYLSPGFSWAGTNVDRYKLTILHTNDVHSRMDPFPANAGKLANMGGAARRSAIIQQIRSSESNVLLLDAGDMLQGTPYFNFFGGEVEFRAMSAMGYDAATLGNHDFDGGIALLEHRLGDISFQLLSANYTFKDNLLEHAVKPYTVFEKGPLRIGVFGLGIELSGLVPDPLYGNTVYSDPIEAANRTAKILRDKEGCHFIICLSHLGYQYENEKVSDVVLAGKSEHIDLIIGGHTHTLLDKPVLKTNALGRSVQIVQVGWGGAYLGRLDIGFERNYKHRCISCTSLSI
ncbi:MAG: metallophosphatase [Saprospiraceae bacterium]|nr:metallophosphatase [Saprospiraceae bacterium]